MKVISKNCSKNQGKDKQKKSMATIGASAYLETRPKVSIEVVRFEKNKKQ